MNGQRILIQADSATTVHEICQAIAKKIGLKEISGFSLYATLYKRVSLTLLSILSTGDVE